MQQISHLDFWQKTCARAFDVGICKVTEGICNRLWKLEKSATLSPAGHHIWVGRVSMTVTCPSACVSDLDLSFQAFQLIEKNRKGLILIHARFSNRHFWLFFLPSKTKFEVLLSMYFCSVHRLLSRSAKKFIVCLGKYWRVRLPHTSPSTQT